MAKPIGTLGVIDTLTVGGRVFTDLTNLITLHAISNAQIYCGMRKPDGSAAYAVTTAKTLTIHALRHKAEVLTVTGTTALLWYLAYGNATIGWDTASAPASPVYECDGSSSNKMHRTAMVSNSYDATQYDISGFTIPASKNVFIEQASAGSRMRVTAFGYET